MNRKLQKIILVCLFVLSLGWFTADGVYAADNAEIMRKWNYTQYYNCAKNNFNRNLATQIVSDKDSVLDIVVGDRGNLAMPSAGFSGASGNINCKTLLKNNIGVPDVTWGDTARSSVLSGLGYEPRVTTKEITVTINYAETQGLIHGSTNTVETTPQSISLTVADGKVISTSHSGILKICDYVFDDTGFRICQSILTKDHKTERIHANNSASGLMGDIEKAIRDVDWSDKDTDDIQVISFGDFDTAATTKDVGNGWMYPPEGSTVSESARKTTEAKSGASSLSDLKFTNSEFYTLYMSYLKHNTTQIACGASASGGDDSYVVKLKTTDGTFKQCRVVFPSGVKPSSITVNTQKYGGYPVISSISLLEVLNWFNTVKEDTLTDIDDSLVPPDGVIEGDVEEDQDGEPEENVEKADCQSSGAAGSLGWIVCPLLEWMADASEEIYNNYIQPSLNVEPQLFNGNSATKTAWSQFQTISNVIFVIFLLVILFSQITGVGIDNYGIKKMLPKLIIAAVLVNLSYYICVICVDISNIFGNSLQAMFEALPAGSSANIEGVEVGIGSGTLVSVSVLAALAAGGVAIVLNPAIILTLLVSAIGVIVSILFLFIMLAVREAAIVVLVVLSPIAFVLYVLPNSKGYFDKYLKIFGALLLFYPLCGLMVGGGNYVSRLLMTNGFAGGGIAAAFTAMMIGVAPILFIPMVLRNSLNALGGIGARLAGVGTGIGRALRGGAERSNLYRSAQESGTQRRARILGGLDRNGNPGAEGSWRRRLATVAAGGNRNRQRSALQYQRMVREQGSLAAADEDDFMLQTATDNEMTRIVASGEINDGGAMQRGLEKALENGDRAKIRAYTDGLAKQGEEGRKAIKNAYDNSVGRMSETSARTFASNIMSNHAADFKNNNRSLFNVANSINNAPTDRPLNLGTVEDYVKNHSDDLKKSTKAETLSGMDDEAFAEAFMGGKGKYKNGTVDLGSLSPEEKKAVGQNAYIALQSNQNMKADRVALLNEILQQSDYTPEPSRVRVVPPTP